MEGRQTVLIIIFCLINLNFSSEVSDDRTKIIIDTDPGTDDAVAIFLALAAPEVRVLAITCTYGNTKETNVEVNVLKTLTVANRTDVPVYPGATEPLFEPYRATDYMGKDGFGDAGFDEPVLGAVDRSKSAAEAMVDLARQFPGQINVLTLGPLTNVAKAAGIDANFTKNVKRFYLMGTKFNFRGQHERRRRDFNLGHDPEANQVFFTSRVNAPTFILSSDILGKRREISKDWRMNVLGKLDSKVVRFLNKIEALVLKKKSYWSDADSITTALMIWPELLLDSFEARVDAVVEGEDRGKVIIDRNAGANNARVATDFDVVGFESKILQYFG